MLFKKYIKSCRINHQLFRSKNIINFSSSRNVSTSLDLFHLFYGKLSLVVLCPHPVNPCSGSLCEPYSTLINELHCVLLNWLSWSYIINVEKHQLVLSNYRLIKWIYVHVNKEYYLIIVIWERLEFFTFLIIHLLLRDRWI